jgi:uncharacterized membrane protein YphA (DoxX/SURF4 family)
MKPTSIAYWTTTGLLVFCMLSGGLAEVARRPENVEGMLRLGYPLYVLTIIGLAKLLGSIALLVPKFPRLKEWAYAGFFFNMVGAAFSHAASGDATWHVYVTLGFAGLTLASRALEPVGRRGGQPREHRGSSVAQLMLASHR